MQLSDGETSKTKTAKITGTVSMKLGGGRTLANMRTNAPSMIPAYAALRRKPVQRNADERGQANDAKAPTNGAAMSAEPTNRAARGQAK